MPILAAIAMIYLSSFSMGCLGGGGAALNPAPSYSGTYCHGYYNKLIIDSVGGVENYTLVLGGSTGTHITMNATGLRVGDRLTLSANGGGYNISYDFTFLNNANNLSGQITGSDGVNTFVWNEYGTKGDCPTIDIAGGAPKFVSTDFVNLANDISDISLFRSASGHDYSDSFESCRSMKHYFSPPIAKRVDNTVPIYSPINGKIVHLEMSNRTGAAFLPDDGVTNQAIYIRSSNQPGLSIKLFHIDISDPALVPGADLVAGQQIGFANMIDPTLGPVHSFDISVEANTPTGIRFISYFDIMTDTLFNNYITWGGGGITRNDFIISQAARDADPLTCAGETFTSFGTLPSWYYNLP
jgi:hypothetical protein